MTVFVHTTETHNKPGKNRVPEDLARESRSKVFWYLQIESQRGRHGLTATGIASLAYCSRFHQIVPHGLRYRGSGVDTGTPS